MIHEIKIKTVKITIHLKGIKSQLKIFKLISIRNFIRKAHQCKLVKNLILESTFM